MIMAQIWHNRIRIDSSPTLEEMRLLEVSLAYFRIAGVVHTDMDQLYIKGSNSQDYYIDLDIMRDSELYKVYNLETDELAFMDDNFDSVKTLTKLHPQLYNLNYVAAIQFIDKKVLQNICKVAEVDCFENKGFIQEDVFLFIAYICMQEYINKFKLNFKVDINKRYKDIRGGYYIEVKK